jgi:hypothetical protein
MAVGIVVGMFAGVFAVSVTGLPVAVAFDDGGAPATTVSILHAAEVTFSDNQIPGHIVWTR